MLARVLTLEKSNVNTRPPLMLELLLMFELLMIGGIS